MRIVIQSSSLRASLRWTQWTLFAMSFLLLGYFLFVTASSWLFQRRANAELKQVLYSPQPAQIEQPPEPAVLSSGALIGRLEVARLGISVPLVEGTDTATLEHAAGHVERTALPGQPGNMAIAAHRDTYFRPLRNIHPDDVIDVTTRTGAYQYRVISTKIVSPDDVSVLRGNEDEILTLVTCYPFYYVGPAPSRFIVRAQRTAAEGHP